MAISSVRSFSDPDEYCSSFRDFQYDLTVTDGGDFAAEHVRVESAQGSVTTVFQ